MTTIKSTLTIATAGIILAGVLGSSSVYAESCEPAQKKAEHYLSGLDVSGSGGALGQACLSLKINIVGQWMNMKCAKDNFYSAEDQGLSKQQADIFEDAAKTSLKIVKSFISVGTDWRSACNMQEIDWTGINY